MHLNWALDGEELCEMEYAGVLVATGALIYSKFIQYPVLGLLDHS